MELTVLRGAEVQDLVEAASKLALRRPILSKEGQWTGCMRHRGVKTRLGHFLCSSVSMFKHFRTKPTNSLEPGSESAERLLLRLAVCLFVLGDLNRFFRFKFSTKISAKNRSPSDLDL